MTNQQIALILEAQRKIEDLRGILDCVMYYSEPLSKNEYEKVREAYDLICKANDKL